MSEQILHIEKLLSREDITTSERRFAQSLRDNFIRYDRLSNRQWAAFQRMEARYNEEVIAQRKMWSARRRLDIQRSRLDIISETHHGLATLPQKS